MDFRLFLVDKVLKMLFKSVIVRIYGFCPCTNALCCKIKGNHFSLLFELCLLPVLYIKKSTGLV